LTALFTRRSHPSQSIFTLMFTVCACVVEAIDEFVTSIFLLIDNGSKILEIN
jgi:hypothetical protein